MRFIVLGCGRMGSGLTEALSRRGHAVTVVDNDPAVFERLPRGLAVETIVGVGFDRDVLVRAGIERADGLAAVTASDDANVVAARLARQVFHVPRVVARVYDPRKAEIYQRLGLTTISTTSWGIHRLTELLCFSRLDAVLSLGSGEVDLIEVEAPHLLVGRAVNDLTIMGEAHVVAISRGGRTFLPTLGTVVEAGDMIHLAVVHSAAERLNALLG